MSLDGEMLSNGDECRMRLFRRYAANLAIHIPALSGMFVCPICEGQFVAADVLHTSLRVDIGHVHPKAIGGKLVTLECRACNARLNRAGDNELVRLHKQWEAMSAQPGTNSIRACIEMPSGRVNVDFTARHIHGDWKHAHPEALRELLRALADRTPVQMTLPEIRPAKLNIGTLHSAHLLLFCSFGYGYLFTPAGQYIRNILKITEQLADAPFLSIEVPTTSDFDRRILYRSGICTFRGGDRCMFVALPVAHPNALCQFVLLPGLWPEDIKTYERIVGQGERWLDGNCHTIDGGPEEQLTAPEYGDCLQFLWRGWTHSNIDMTKIMYAIRARANDNTVHKVDAASVGARFGIVDSYLDMCVGSLVERGFLQRMPKRKQPYLVRLTAKAAASFRINRSRRISAER